MAESDGWGFGAVGGEFHVGLEGELQQLLLLMLVGWEKEEGGMGRDEFFAFLADAALAEEEKLAALLEGGDEGGPFLEGYVAG